MSHSDLNVVQVTSWLSRQGGGIPPVVWALAEALNQNDVRASVVGLEDEWVKIDVVKNKIPFSTGKTAGPKSFGYAPDLRRQILNAVNPPGIIHSHGLWMYPGLAARKCAAAANCPLVISPHGMLEPWAVNHSRLKKQIAGMLFEDRNLRAADCLHALCPAEAENFRRHGLTNPVAIIPNGIKPDFSNSPPGCEALLQRFPQLSQRRRALFLSRLHPKKGLANLLQAWQKLAAAHPGWCLMIAGSGSPHYEAELKFFVQQAGLTGDVFFLGPVYQKEKSEVLAAADAFVLPSFSEGFSMAILEAAAVGLPILLTRECNFPELAKAGAAIEITTDAAGIEAGFGQLMGFSNDQRKNMGRRGRELVTHSYTWPAVGGQMREVYHWLSGKGVRPACVKTD